METRSLYHQSLEDLQKFLLNMGIEVERQIQLAVDSLAKLDEQLAREAIAKDDLIDEMMLKVEEHCLRLIALQQPLANDLRLIGTATKIAIDLERIADHAVDIAKITIRICNEQYIQLLIKQLNDIPRMAEITMIMLRESLVAYGEKDIQLAATLADKDDEVDKIYNSLVTEMLSLMGSDQSSNRQLMQLTMVAHYLERVADHTTNIGEGVIYMVTGKRKDLNV